MKEKWIPGYSGYIPADRGSDDFCLSILLWMMTEGMAGTRRKPILR